MFLCNTCGETNPDNAMNRGKGRKSKNLCKSCHSKSTGVRGRANRLRCLEYKGGKCVRCGYDEHPAALEFHHVEGKDPEWVSFRYWSFERAKTELDKCVILCSNCHRIEHAGY